MYFLPYLDNFILSGQATQWYCDKPAGFCETFTRLLGYHFGSVVGGSFLNAFFNLIDFFL
jgi:Plasma-membrane choline transporter